MNYPALLALVCGYASLSIEILWVRLYGFANYSTPAAFGFVLGAYLFGIAFGALLGGWVCRGQHNANKLWTYCVAALIVSAFATVALPGAYAWMVLEAVIDPVISILIVASASSILAFVFPIAHHLGAGARNDQQGRRFAAVYTANVMGAAIGPVVTGYLLLEFLSLQQTYLALALVQLVAAVLFLSMIEGRPAHNRMIGTNALMALVLWAVAFTVDPHWLIQQVNHQSEHAKAVIENRHGVITLFPKATNDDAVYGGNVYDGRTNLDPDRNTNGLERPLLLAALRPEPKRVLIVGLSIGTWLALAREFPGVEHIDVIEINPGYLKATQAYPVQADAILDPRVNLVIDDARRWLRLHWEQRYDMVIMNSTWHWRANASMLLSAEFLQLIRRHMASGAVMAFNATGSGDAFFTASQVFEHAYRYSNFVYAADFDFRSRKEDPATRNLYAGLQMRGHPFFAPGSVAIDKFIKTPFVTVEQAQKDTGRPFELITDQNMITEFKYGRRLY